MVAVGLSLQPDLEFLELLEPIVRSEIDYVEIAPETTWWERPDGTLEENHYHARFADIIDRSGVFAVAHGVGLSMASIDPSNRARQERWLERMRRDQRVFDYRWYTDHGGASHLDGRCMVLPMPVPMTLGRVAAIQQTLRAMQSVVPDVGLENSAFYFTLGDPLNEPGFFRRIVEPHGFHLLFDLHNLHTLAVNTGIDAASYLEQIPWHKVIEIHVAGGARSEPGWLQGEQTLLLDGHDRAVPEAVWQLLEAALPRCSSLRGVTLERMEGTVGPGDAAEVAGEIARIRELVQRLAEPEHRPVTNVDARALAELSSEAEHKVDQRIAAAMRSADPTEAMAEIARDPSLPELLRRAVAAAAPSGVAITALLVARLRFERLIQGSKLAATWFAADPEGFAAAFRDYHQSVEPTAYFPQAEAALFERWRHN